MPLIKSAIKPLETSGTQPKEQEQKAKDVKEDSLTLEQRLDAYALDESPRERAILVNGASAAASTSMGAVQHGGESFETYVHRVDQLTRALVEQRLKLLGY